MLVQHNGWYLCWQAPASQQTEECIHTNAHASALLHSDMTSMQHQQGNISHSSDLPDLDTLAELGRVTGAVVGLDVEAGSDGVLAESPAKLPSEGCEESCGGVLDPEALP